jgi:hypothetical protein
VIYIQCAVLNSRRFRHLIMGAVSGIEFLVVVFLFYF